MNRSTGLSRVVLGVAGLALLACAENQPTAPRTASGPDGLVAEPDAVVAPEFNILASTFDDRAFSAASDGTNYLVGIQSGSPTRVKARTVSSTGTLGTLYSTGRTGNEPLVAFDGTNYLMVWDDHTGPANVYGVFLNTSGAAVGSVFPITTNNLSMQVNGLAFGGGKFLVAYTVSDVVTGTKLKGRLITPAGSIGPELSIALSVGNSSGLNGVGTDGTDFLVGYTVGANSETVKARLVRNDGTMAAGTTVNASPAPSDEPVTVAFNGGNYLVVWNDNVGVHETNVYGRLVTQAGAATGLRITIDGSAGDQIGSGVVAYGSNFFVTWVVVAADPALSKVRGRFYSTAGAPLGTIKGLFSTNPTTHKLPIAAGPVVNGTTAFFMILRALPGADPQEFDQMTAWDVRGSFKTLAP